MESSYSWFSLFSLKMLMCVLCTIHSERVCGGGTTCLPSSFQLNRYPDILMKNFVIILEYEDLTNEGYLER